MGDWETGDQTRLHLYYDTRGPQHPKYSHWSVTKDNVGTRMTKIRNNQSKSVTIQVTISQIYKQNFVWMRIQARGWVCCLSGFIEKI